MIQAYLFARINGKKINKISFFAISSLFFILPGCAHRNQDPSKVAKQDSLTDVVKEISNPEYEGRGLGTHGLEKARDFLVHQFELMHLQSGFTMPPMHAQPESSSFLQSFAVFTGNVQIGKNELSAAKKGEFIPYSFSANGTLQAKRVVFAGYGITVRGSEMSNYDDFAGKNVKGKLVILLLGDPGRGSKNSFFRDPSNYHFSTPIYKVQNAELHGAAGVLLVRDPFSLGDEQEPPLRFQSMQGAGAKMDILAGQISVKCAERILKKNLKQWQQRVLKSQRADSFEAKTNLRMEVSLRRNVGKAENVAGFLPGSDPKLKREFIVIGAHYDHLGFGGDNSLASRSESAVHPGADDNASGTQAVITLARKIAKEQKNQRSVLFVLFSAEESGLLGSKYYVDQMMLPDPKGKVIAMINLDMVGRMRDQNLNVLASRSGDSFAGSLKALAEKHRIQLKNGGYGSRSSDHASFLMGKIPALFFNTGGHEDYHRPTDTFDKIREDSLRTVTNFVSDVFYSIDSQVVAPKFIDDPQEELSLPSSVRGYGSYFGTIPEFTEGNRPGVLLQGVKDSSPAQALGLVKGDLLVGMGEINVKNLHDFVFALRYYRAGEAIEVRWIRDGKEFQGKATLKNRD